ncbi:MAG TPA: hypothetical protein VKG62_09325 [Solirubrobacteraceae bacterium]|nr:hypothetical protein [Solirubrobacteraceae bacterium]
MLESSQPPSRAEDGHDRPDSGAGEVIDALPVPASAPAGGRVSRLSRALPGGRTRSAGALGAAQAAAVAAGGFLAGAALVGLVRHRERGSSTLARGVGVGRSLARGGGAAKTPEVLQIVGTRSLLLDVHLLAPRNPDG